MKKYHDKVIPNTDKSRGVVIYHILRSSMNSLAISFESLFEDSVWCGVKIKKKHNDTVLYIP